MFKAKIVITVLFFLIANVQARQPHILLMDSVGWTWRGVEGVLLSHYKMLKASGRDVTLLANKNGLMHKAFNEYGLACKLLNDNTHGLTSLMQLQEDVANVCKQKPVDVVICLRRDQLPTLKTLRSMFNFKIVFVQHVPFNLSSAYSNHVARDQLKGIDGVLAVAPGIKDDFVVLNAQYDLGIKHITYIPAASDDAHFAAHISQETRQEYFKTKFNVDVGELPVLCTLANFYTSGFKRQEVLVKALELLKKKGLKFHAFLAGGGAQSTQTTIKELSKSLEMTDCIHFIGFTQSADLLSHSDFHVLSSDTREAFGLVTVEAGYLKKPVIGSRGSGADSIIVDGLNGLLFEANNVADLARAIEALLTDTPRRLEMGTAHYQHVMEHFSSAALAKQLNNYCDILYQEKLAQEADFPAFVIDEHDSNLPYHLNVKTFQQELENYTPPAEKHFTFMVASYNNANFYKRNLDSIYAQHYSNYSVVYVDDHSPDGTAHLVEEYIKAHNQQHRTVLIKNSERKCCLANAYGAISQLPDDTIVVVVDGDDWLAHDQVLPLLNKIYTKWDVWMTHGTYKKEPARVGRPHDCKRIPETVIETNSIRKFGWCMGHLRTFYAWLFKKVKHEDLLIDGKFFDMSSDLSYMFPMVEMAHRHTLYVPDILYVYNMQTPLNEFKVNRSRQLSLKKYIEALPPYQPLTTSQV
jgi:glycosyltransferase involved in cell wall biosynthesis